MEKKNKTNFIAKQNLVYDFKLVDKLCNLYKFWFKNKTENKFLRAYFKAAKKI